MIAGLDDGTERRWVMAKIVQLLMPTQNVGFQFLALDNDGEVLVGTLTQPKTGPVMTWQKVEAHYK